MGITEERIECIKKQAEILESCGKAAGGMSTELDALLQDNQQMEQQIERLNEANDRLRERLNRSENHDGYMKLPLGADGEPIRVGETVYRIGDGAKLCVSSIGYVEGGACVIHAKMSPAFLSSAYSAQALTHKKPEPPDSWEKLEEDAAKEVCAYAGASFSIVNQDMYSCTGCRFDDCSSRKGSCWLQMISELMARAKKLAGIEEEAER